MPRPRVHPHQRQRVLEACNLCREAKKRCSGTAPCTYCLRRRVGASCQISNRPRGSSDSITVSRPDPAVGVEPELGAQSAAQQPAEFDQALPSISIPANESLITPEPGHGTFQPISPSESRATEVDQGTTSNLSNPVGGVLSSSEPVDKNAFSPEATRASARMLRNLRGEHVYLGEGASLSFLQLIRGKVADQIGPSPFSRSGRSDTMLEQESTQGQAHVPTNIGVEEQLAYLDGFNSVTGGIIDPFAPLELETLLAAQATPDSQQLALVNLVSAIGMQCEPTSDMRDRELAHFHQAQKQAFAGMLEDPDVDMVRIFLVMAFYLLGECRRNTAFTYLGIAARAAVSLGLHSRETYTDMNDPQHQLRLRVWMSLRVLDIFVSSVLGRPAATAGIHSDMKGMIDSVVASTQDEGFICLSASYTLVNLIHSAVDRIYDRKDVTIPVVEEHLRELEQWSRGLPDVLRTPPFSKRSSNSPPEKGSIGKVHVSCLYYFAVTLVTRPILIFTLTNQPPSDFVHAHLASTCLDAATFITQTCWGARKLDLFQPNMRILQAIIFPAGLVLGFEAFAKSSVPYAIESSFHTARELLNGFGAKSPQSALYYDILTSLSTAVSERRARASAKGRGSYVAKIFSFDPPSDEAQEVEVAQGSFVGAMDEEVRGQMDDMFPSWPTRQTTPMVSGDMSLDWDSLNISLWDSFPYLN